MKKLLSLILSLVLCLSLCACGEPQPTDPDVSPNSDSSDTVSGNASDPTFGNGTPDPGTDLPYRYTLSAGDGCSAAIGTDGTIAVAAPQPETPYYGTDVQIVSLDVYSYCIVLLSNGTVRVKNIRGDIRGNLWDMENTWSWSDIVAVAAGYSHNVGLKSDGTVVFNGHIPDKAAEALATWENIVAIDAGYGTTVGLKEDGTVVACGEVPDVSSWTDIVAVSTNSKIVLGLKSDGTVIAATSKSNDPRCEVSSWTDIVAISAGLNHCVGLKSDGTVVSTQIIDADFDLGQCDVEGWTDIVAISANYTHTLGLRADGTVVAAGANYNKGCDIGNWNEIKLP